MTMGTSVDASIVHAVCTAASVDDELSFREQADGRSATTNTSAKGA